MVGKTYERVEGKKIEEVKIYYYLVEESNDKWKKQAHQDYVLLYERSN